MKNVLLGILVLATTSSAVAGSADLMYPVGSYVGRCDSTFLEHIYKDGKKVGIRNAVQSMRAQLDVSENFGIETLKYKEVFTINGHEVEPVEYTNTVNRMAQGVWVEGGGEGQTTWSWTWKRQDDGVLLRDIDPKSDYTEEHWKIVSGSVIHTSQNSKRKPSAPIKIKDGYLNISSRMICVYEKQ